MTVAILCPGPSLSTHRRERFAAYDVCIGVNRAVNFLPCDWLVAADWVLFKHHAPKQGCALFTSEESFRHLSRRFDRVGEFNVRTFETMESVVSSSRIQWRGKSFTAAIVLAIGLGATMIDVYGNDQTNEPDYDGVTVTGCVRNASRWAAEKIVVQELADLAKANGVEVTFIGRN